ncbi:MAG: hypothetical protein HRT44_06265, partial [Bdellovibrionales bacterium]|nr:hypothetical protein [Bdellovibrionales bacterium]NQZ18846.1 hypothetical protein [Bdellovibrionales bacterium]
MRILALMAFMSIFTVNCGRSSFTIANPIGLNTLEQADPELTEIGDIDNNDTVELSSTAELDPTVVNGLNMEANSRCEPLARRAYRKLLTLIRRTERFDNTGDDIFLLRNEITKQRMDRIVRRMIKFDCIPNASTYEIYDENTYLSYTLDDNHLVNGDFEIFKADRRKTRLEDGWTIINSHNVPGWKIENVYDNEETLTCDYLEIQTSGVVTQSFSGNQHIELDSHCTNDNGQKKRGDATIQISQSFNVTHPGVYSLRMKAQRRSGRFGELEVAIYQSKRDKDFLSVDL